VRESPFVIVSASGSSASVFAVLPGGLGLSISVKASESRSRQRDGDFRGPARRRSCSRGRTESR